MNTLQIWNALLYNNYTKKNFKGVFPLDKIPSIIKDKPALIVVNTDKSNQPGTHWVALYLSSKGGGEYFDSYGRKPIQKEILNFFRRNNIKSIIYNKTLLQDYFSIVCGQYCCVYLLYKAKNCSLNNFVKLFDKKKNLQENDEFVSKMFLNNFSIKKIKKRNNMNNVQSCCAFHH